MFSLCPSASPTYCSACTVGKYCYSFTSYDDKAQKWHCGNSADETIMLTLSLWLTHPPTQQKLSRLWGRWRDGGSSGRGVVLLSKFSAFQYLLCIFGCCLSLEVLANEAYETVFCCATNAKIETAVPCDVTPDPSPLHAVLKNFFALEHIYCGCQGKMPIGIEVWMSWMGKWVTPYLLLLSHFVNL